MRKGAFSTIRFVVFLLLVLLTHVSEVMSASVPSWWEEMEIWGDEAAMELELDFPTMWMSQRASRIPVNVDSFGAAGDGVTDDTQAFLNAWDKACSLKNAVFLVPEQRHYLVNAARFKGPCESNFIVQISGTIVAPDEPNGWDPKNPRIWLYFSKLKGVRIQGGGVIDGSGSKCLQDGEKRAPLMESRGDVSNPKF